VCSRRNTRATPTPVATHRAIPHRLYRTLLVWHARCMKTRVSERHTTRKKGHPTMRNTSTQDTIPTANGEHIWRESAD